MKKKIIIIISLVFLFLIAFIVIKSNKKLDTDVKESLSNTETLEEFNIQEEKEIIPEVYYKDWTGELTDEEMKGYYDSIYQYVSEYTSAIYNYDGTDTEYINHIKSYYADINEYPNINIDYIEKLPSYLQNHQIASTFNDIKINTITFQDKVDSTVIVSIRGIIKANMQSNTYEQGIYDTIFRSNILIEDDKMSLLNIELAKLFEDGVQAYWLDEDKITISYRGTFVENWSIGIENYSSEE